MRVLHLGMGRFHRAHQAWYLERLNRLEGSPEWTISAWSLRTPQPPGPRSYHVWVPGLPPERVESIVETGSLERDRELWATRWADPELSLVTLTVTEKGYAQPLFQLLAQALERRAGLGLGPVTLLSCDNLRGNGLRLKEGVQEACSEARAWVEGKCRFPNSVVDRIVPAFSSEDHQAWQERSGLSDPELIVTEAFSQWVVETDWAGPAPALERVGVEWVEEARPYEEMKLSLLNLPHSWLAYAGLPRGYRFVHQAMADPELAGAVQALQEEASDLLTGVPSEQLRDYASRVRQRFYNLDLPHQLEQIAMDGSSKLPQRLLPLLQRDPRPALSRVLPAWLDFLHGEVQAGRLLQDPLAPRLAQLSSLDRAAFHGRVLEMLRWPCP